MKVTFDRNVKIGLVALLAAEAALLSGATTGAVYLKDDKKAEIATAVATEKRISRIENKLDALNDKIDLIFQISPPHK